MIAVLWIVAVFSCIASVPFVMSLSNGFLLACVTTYHERHTGTDV